ncbi:MAG: hypothetical protein ACFFDY_00565 [Candidatus Thorarchaeota archaeon]
MFNVIRDLVKSSQIITIVTSDTTFDDAVITDVDDLFFKFDYPGNGLTYIYPLEAIVQIRFPISP